MYKTLNKFINFTIAFIILIFLINMDEKELYFWTLIDIFNNNPTNTFIVILFFIAASIFVAFFWINFGKLENKNKELSNWLISNFGKYTPIKFGSIILRINNTSISKNKKESFKIMVFEQLLMILQGASVIFFIFIKVNTQYKIVLIIFYLFALNYLIKKLFSKIIETRYLYLLNIGLIINLTGINIFLESTEYTRHLDLAIVYIVSTSLSILIIFVPAGLVVRESLFIYLSKTLLDLSNLVFVALSLRILYIATDFILLFIGLGIKKYSK